MRNEVVFTRVTLSMEEKVQWILSQVHEVIVAFKPSSVGLDVSRDTVVRVVGWEKPLDGINTDGSYRGDLNEAGSEGVIRGTNEEWLSGFIYNVGCSN